MGKKKEEIKKEDLIQAVVIADNFNQRCSHTTFSLYLLYSELSFQTPLLIALFVLTYVRP